MGQVAVCRTCGERFPRRPGEHAFQVVDRLRKHQEAAHPNPAHRMVRGSSLRGPWGGH